MKGQTNRAIIERHIPRDVAKQHDRCRNQLMATVTWAAVGRLQIPPPTPLPWIMYRTLIVWKNGIVEVDGGQPLAGERAKIRDKRLHATGFQLFGLLGNEVLQNIDAVIEAIRTPSPPRPSP